MGKVYCNDGVILAKVVRDHINDNWTKKPATLILGDFAHKPPSLMLQELAHAEIIRPYIDGSYIGQWSFAVYMRINAEDSAARLSASAALNELADWFREKDASGAFVNLPIIDLNRRATKIEMSTTPALAAQFDGGVEDYQAVYQLEYKFSHRR